MFAIETENNKNNSCADRDGHGQTVRLIKFGYKAFVYFWKGRLSGNGGPDVTLDRLIILILSQISS